MGRGLPHVPPVVPRGNVHRHRLRSRIAGHFVQSQSPSFGRGFGGSGRCHDSHRLLGILHLGNYLPLLRHHRRRLHRSGREGLRRKNVQRSSLVAPLLGNYRVPAEHPPLHPRRMFVGRDHFELRRKGLGLLVHALCAGHRYSFLFGIRLLPGNCEYWNRIQLARGCIYGVWWITWSSWNCAWSSPLLRNSSFHGRQRSQ
mmetsp:Transcript_35992/g.66785  ORF Transcript_35992/g.66785 Transcript_35992/m.66785 type:complete len:200 (+) Transcript_35992:319-918(+)